VQQIIAQAGWTDPDLRFWHYRDTDHVEVDLVITRGRQTWGVQRCSAMRLIGGPGHALEELLVVLPAIHAGGIERAVHLVVAQRSDRSLALVESVAALVPFQP